MEEKEVSLSGVALIEVMRERLNKIADITFSFELGSKLPHEYNIITKYMRDKKFFFDPIPNHEEADELAKMVNECDEIIKNLIKNECSEYLFLEGSVGTMPKQKCMEWLSLIIEYNILESNTIVQIMHSVMLDK